MAISTAPLIALVMQPKKQDRFAFSGFPEPMFMLTIVVTAALKQPGILKQIVEILLAML